MSKWRVFVTARVEVEHSCDCECCELLSLLEINAVYEAIIDAASLAEAEAEAAAGINAALDTETPRGYWPDESTVEITQDVRPLDDLTLARLIGYPTLPGLGV